MSREEEEFFATDETWIFTDWFVNYFYLCFICVNPWLNFSSFAAFASFASIARNFSKLIYLKPNLISILALGT